VNRIMLLGCITVLAVTCAFGGNNPEVKIAVHVTEHEPDRACTRGFPEIEDACDIQARFKGCGDIDFFPVFLDVSEYRGLEYAAAWPGSYSCVYTVCSYTHIGEIIWPGDWVSQCWAECMPGPVAVPGWGWITTDVPGSVCITPVQWTGEITIADCEDDAQLDHPVANFCAGVCGADGDDPCKALDQATVASTWGSVKAMFK
jgi:hypothetical protein